MIRVPTSFTAGRKITLNGVTYQPGDPVTNAIAKKIHNLSALMSNGMLLPNVDVNFRKVGKPHIPTAITATTRKEL